MMQQKVKKINTRKKNDVRNETGRKEKNDAIILFAKICGHKKDTRKVVQKLCAHKN